jgi:hypothetical protein
LSRYETTLVVHASPTAIKAFKAEVFPLLEARGVELRGEEATALWLHEQKASESILYDVCHGLSLLRPALSFFVRLKRDTGTTILYCRESETLAYRRTDASSTDSGDVLDREYGPVGFLEAGLSQFCLDLS